MNRPFTTTMTRGHRVKGTGYSSGKSGQDKGGWERAVKKLMKVC